MKEFSEFPSNTKLVLITNSSRVLINLNFYLISIPTSTPTEILQNFRRKNPLPELCAINRLFW